MIDQYYFYERKVFKKLPIDWEKMNDSNFKIKLSNSEPDLVK